MELVGELPASHHLASTSQGGWRCRDVGERGLERCTTDEAPPGLGADSSPPKHFSSHQSRRAGREACSCSLHHLSLSFVKLFSPGSPLGHGALLTHSCRANMVSCFINNSRISRFIIDYTLSAACEQWQWYCLKKRTWKYEYSCFQSGETMWDQCDNGYQEVWH